jgi:3-hydroxyacyl-CoA dehydrogenase
MTDVHFERREKIGILTLDNPPVNALSTELVGAIHKRVTEGLADESLVGFVLTGAGKMFVAGADIREFNRPRPPNAPGLRDVVALIEGANKPFVAAINGVAAGGGLELALACHARVTQPRARVGLPEVKLGLLPGAGGTQRLPRLIGVEAAAELMLTGELVPGERAFTLGIVDEVTKPEAVVDAAVRLAEALAARGKPLRRTSALEDKIGAARAKPDLFAELRAAAKKRFRGAEAPLAIVDCIEAAVTKPFAEGSTLEGTRFEKLRTGAQSRALRHVFFAEREVSKIPDVPPATPTLPVKQAAVIGCGTMGGGIAMNFANAGIPVRVLESDPAALDRGMATIRKNYAATVSKGRLDQAEMDKRMGLIAPVGSYDELKDVDIVIEAVFEEMDIKEQVFGKLDAVCKPDAILATNTSTLDVDRIASFTKRPEKVIGTHFFSPANVMKLLEVVRGKKTAKDVIATVMGLGKTINKVAVLVGVCDGFVGNRMLYAYSRQANALLYEGALPQDIDKAIYDFGFPMGPFAMNDLAGIDVGWRIRKRRAAEGTENFSGYIVSDRLCEMGRFGQKTGAGWYRYEGGSRTPIPDPLVEEMIVKASAELGIKRRKIDAAEIVERCMYPLINEGAKILEEGLALRASDIDIVWIYGYGFPANKGGPMFYADEIGLATVHDAMRRLNDLHGEELKPAPLLARLASEGKRFEDA